MSWTWNGLDNIVVIIGCRCNQIHLLQNHNTRTPCTPVCSLRARQTEIESLAVRSCTMRLLKCCHCWKAWSAQEHDTKASKCAPTQLLHQRIGRVTGSDLVHARRKEKTTNTGSRREMQIMIWLHSLHRTVKWENDSKLMDVIGFSNPCTGVGLENVFASDYVWLFVKYEKHVSKSLFVKWALDSLQDQSCVYMCTAHWSAFTQRRISLSFQSL